VHSCPRYGANRYDNLNFRSSWFGDITRRLEEVADLKEEEEKKIEINEDMRVDQ
jgi:hypothetical protein